MTFAVFVRKFKCLIKALAWMVGLAEKNRFSTFSPLATRLYYFFTLTDWCTGDLLKTDLLISEPVRVILPALRLFGEGKTS